MLIGSRRVVLSSRQFGALLVKSRLSNPSGLRRLGIMASHHEQLTTKKSGTWSSRVEQMVQNSALLNQTRSMSSSAGKPTPIMDYETLLGRMDKGDIVLVDVRDRNEIIQTGSLKHGATTALNIPLARIQEGVLGMSDDDFEDEFGFPKPKPTDPVVFSCRSGVRSEVASRIAIEYHGYENVHNYLGSALEWFSKH